MSGGMHTRLVLVDLLLFNGSQHDLNNLARFNAEFLNLCLWNVNAVVLLDLCCKNSVALEQSLDHNPPLVLQVTETVRNCLFDDLSDDFVRHLIE